MNLCTLNGQLNGINRDWKGNKFLQHPKTQILNHLVKSITNQPKNFSHTPNTMPQNWIMNKKEN